MMGLRHHIAVAGRRLRDRRVHDVDAAVRRGETASHRLGDCYITRVDGCD